MRLERTSGDLRSVGGQLLALIQQLTGEPPTFYDRNGGYKATCHGKVLWLRLIGKRGRKTPPNSAKLFVKWDQRPAGVGVTQAHNWYGSRPSAEFVAQVGNPIEVEQATEFIQAFFREAYEPATC